MCSVICRVRMEFISCRVLRENIPHKPSPWWVGEGRGDSKLPGKLVTGGRQRVPQGSGPCSSALGGDHRTLALLVQRRFWNALLTHLGKSKIYLSPTCFCSQEAAMHAAAPTGPWGGPTAQWVWGGPLAERVGVQVGSRSWVSY